MSNRGKTILISICIIFIVCTLVYGIIAIPSQYGDNILFGFMAFISFVCIVFISDSSKKHLWKEDFQNESEKAMFGDNPDTSSNKDEAEVEKTL